MSAISVTASAEAVAIASGAIICGLIDTFVEKGLLTRPEVNKLLAGCVRTAGANHPHGFGASQVVAGLAVQFSAGNV